MKKILSILTISAFLLVGANFAMAGNGDSKPCPPSSPNAGAIGEPCGFGDDSGTDTQTAEGDFDIDTFAIGGSISLDGKLIPGGAAGGIGAAGGVAFGTASGSFESFETPVYKYVGFKKGDYSCIGPICWPDSRWGSYDLVGYKVHALGSTEGELTSIGGGFTKTDAYRFDPEIGDIGIGVGSYTHNTQVMTGGSLYLEAEGLAEAHGFIGGIAGQGSLDGSIVVGSPLPMWDSNGLSAAIAGQGSYGGFVGGGIAGLYGDVELDANINMDGYTQTESYRAIDFFEGGKTEIMGSFVNTRTTVVSSGGVDRSGLATGFLEGGYKAAGFAATKTIQVTNSGMAKATAVGTYSGSGPLGTNFNGQAVGYSNTSATTLDGYNGSVMSSSAGMKVSNTPVPAPVVDVD